MSTNIASAVVTVTIAAANEEHSVTTMALGSGMLYAWDNDALYASGEVAHMMKDIGLGVLRWPGGAVSGYYHWDNLNGNGWKDSWNPAYDPADDQPPENFMDLDEYMAVIDETGAEIMLGINMSSGKEWNREMDGIAEASNLVVYCQNQGYDVKYIFLDNEVYHHGNPYNQDPDGDGESWSAASYATSFNLYATAIKTIFPDAKLIANWRNNVTTVGFETDITTMFGIAGSNIDYVDIHFYWEWDSADWPLWKSQQPMKRTGTSFSYKDSVIYANNLFSSLGYPDIKTAVMEWNTGPGPWQTNTTHNNFKTALIQTEMQTQFLQAGLDIGLMFATHSPNVTAEEDKHIMKSSGELNSTALWMWLYSKIAGKTIVQSSSPAAGIYIITAKGSQGEMVTYLLNKTDTDQTVEFDISGYTVNDVSEAWRFYDDGTGNGALQTIGIWETGGKKRTTLKADSLNMIGFNYPDTDLDNIDDVWEVKHFGDTTTADATSDTDLDGSSDYDESIVGTDPNDPLSLSSIQHTLLTPANPLPDGMLIGWDTSSGSSSDFSAAGVSGSLLTGNAYGVDASAGSDDGTFGSTNVGASTATTAYAVRTDTPGSKDTVGINIINNTGMDLRLDTIHFDYGRWFDGGPKDVTLTYASGDLGVTTNTTINSANGMLDLAKVADYQDFDWSLAGLADQILADGEEATFNLIASNASSGISNGAFDNIAVSGGGIAGASNPSVELAWRAYTGKKYSVMSNTNLVTGTWTESSSFIGRPEDTTVSVELTTPGFYRVDVTP